MITIWVKKDDNNWELIEELQDDLALAQRIMDLRSTGADYRAEKVTELSSTILDV